MADFLREFGLAALGAFAVLGSSVILVWAGRRDRNQDELQKTKNRIDRMAVEIRHIEREVKIESFYPGAEL